MNIKLGLSKTRIYRIWKNLKSRCDNKNTKMYQYYGSKGITYDTKWGTFEGFYEDMGDSYVEGLTLDRVDNTRGYFKSNCRWVSYSEQAKNKGKNIRNNSGFTGVYLGKGKNGGITSYIAQVVDLKGRKKSKSFSFKKYGEELALLAACEYRDKQIILLNLQGAGYMRGHGL